MQVEQYFSFLIPLSSHSVADNLPSLYFLQKHFTPKHQYASSPYCSLYISLTAFTENVSKNQELLEFAIISLIPMTFMFDSGVIHWEKLDFKG